MNISSLGQRKSDPASRRESKRSFGLFRYINKKRNNDDDDSGHLVEAFCYTIEATTMILNPMSSAPIGNEPSFEQIKHAQNGYMLAKSCSRAEICHFRRWSAEQLPGALAAIAEFDWSVEERNALLIKGLFHALRVKKDLAASKWTIGALTLRADREGSSRMVSTERLITDVYMIEFDHSLRERDEILNALDTSRESAERYAALVESLALGGAILVNPANPSASQSSRL